MMQKAKSPTHFFATLLMIFSLGIICAGAWSYFKKMSTQQHTTPVEEPQKLKYQTQSGKPPQFVVLSFDGSRSLEMWKATRAFAQRLKEKNISLHFTYFISGVYFLPSSAAAQYHPPGYPVGYSAIGFADTVAEIPERVKQVNFAVSEGHEIGSHANGHFAGSRWNAAQWEQEFAQFDAMLFGWEKFVPSEGQSLEPLKITAKDIHGFRAPLLSRNPALYEVLGNRHFWYDSSGVNSSPSAWPVKDEHGTWLIPMSDIPLAGTRTRTIAMDYNFYDLQSKSRDVARRGTPLWQKFYQQMHDSYMMYFTENYQGNRAPVLVGHHFSTWNDEVYWQVMQDFAEKVCGQPEVSCVTFSELTEYLNEHPPVSTSPSPVSHQP